MSTYTRTTTAVGSGTPASPSALAAAASVTTAAFVLEASAVNVPEGKLRVVLIIGSTAPTTAPTVAFLTSIDGTNFAPVLTYVCANVASTTYTYDFVADVEDQAIEATIVCGATTGITYWVQGGTIGGP